MCGNIHSIDNKQGGITIEKDHEIGYHARLIDQLTLTERMKITTKTRNRLFSAITLYIITMILLSLLL